MLWRNAGKTICNLFVAFYACISAITYANEPVEVKYARSENISPLYIKQSQYFFDLFQLALEKSGESFQIKTVSIPSSIPQGRSILLLQQDYYNVHWMTTNPERESLLLPIRIPLFKGLIGVRLMLIHRDTPNLFAYVKSVDQLKAFLAGQGRDWPDTQLLRQQGFRVQEATRADELIRMLSKKRLDYFPRSILEIWHEKQLFESLPIEIDQHIALHYPSAIYFFVTKENTSLHNAIERGLNKAIADGSFDELFDQYIGMDLKNSHFSKRTVINIPNPNMTKETPLTKSQYWFSFAHSKIDN